MALRSAASLQRVLSNGDDDGMFWDYGQAAGLRTGMCVCAAPSTRLTPAVCSPLFMIHSLTCLAAGFLCSIKNK